MVDWNSTATPNYRDLKNALDEWYGNIAMPSYSTQGYDFNFSLSTISTDIYTIIPNDGYSCNYSPVEIAKKRKFQEYKQRLLQE